MRTELWDCHGQAIAYIDDDKQSIFLQDGTPVAWLSGTSVYNYAGRFLGWFWQGWIFGRDGKCLMFIEHSQPRPAKPFRKMPEDRADQGLRPSRAHREPSPKRREREAIWSTQSAQSFFQR